MVKPNSPARVGDVLSSEDTTLATLVKHTKSLSCLESLLCGIAGPELNEQFQVAAVRQDRLVLLTPTASWATRLRMHSGQLLEGLQNSGYDHLKYIDIRVAPLNKSPEEQRHRKPHSSAAKLALKQMSQLLETGSSSPKPDSDHEA